MTLKIIIQDGEQDIVKAVHAIETFADHIAEKIATEFGLKKEAVAATVTQAIHSAPLSDESTIGGTAAGETIAAAAAGDSVASAGAADTVVS